MKTELKIVETQPPALLVEVRGEVVHSNAETFREYVRKWLAGFKSELKSDADFAQAEADAKLLKEHERAVASAKEKALADAEQLNGLFQLLDGTSEEIRQARLNLERQITKNKEAVRSEIIETGLAAVLNGHGGRFRVQFEEAAKGKRSFETMRAAVEATAQKVNAVIAANIALLDAHAQQQGCVLIPDRKSLEVWETPALVEAELARRIEAHKAEAERKRLEAEAAQARKEAEEARKREQAAKAAPAPAPAPATVETPESIPYIPNNPNMCAQEVAARAEEAKETPLGFDGEWEQWLNTVRESMAPLKTARNLLSEPVAVAKAARFALAVGAAWKEMVS